MQRHLCKKNLLNNRLCNQLTSWLSERTPSVVSLRLALIGSRSMLMQSLPCRNSSYKIHSDVIPPSDLQ